jgi:hypothetical protein
MLSSLSAVYGVYYFAFLGIFQDWHQTAVYILCSRNNNICLCMKNAAYPWQLVTFNNKKMPLVEGQAHLEGGLKEQEARAITRGILLFIYQTERKIQIKLFES